MVVMCAILAYYFIFTNFLQDRIYGPKRNILSGLLVVYGLYRTYRVYQLMKPKKK